MSGSIFNLAGSDPLSTLRYNSLSTFLKERFGEKVFKVSLWGGMTCPNRDGSKGSGGCIYCNPLSNRPFVSAGRTVKEQLVEGIEYARKRHRANKLIAYFQHYSNTYGNIEELRRLYNDAICHPDIVGLAVSTRPDCLEPETWNLLEHLNARTFLWLELGLQSAKEETLKFLNRGHTVKDFTDAVDAAHRHGIKVCAHIILGLPGETRQDMLDTIKFLAEHKVWGVKIHNLHVLKDTPLEKMYNVAQDFSPANNKEKIKCLTLEEYASLVVDCLEHLPKDVVIHRFNSHSPRELTVAPLWSINKLATLNAVHNEISRRDTYQGKATSVPGTNNKIKKRPG